MRSEHLPGVYVENIKSMFELRDALDLAVAERRLNYKQAATAEMMALHADWNAERIVRMSIDEKRKRRRKDYDRTLKEWHAVIEAGFYVPVRKSPRGGRQYDWRPVRPRLYDGHVRERDTGCDPYGVELDPADRPVRTERDVRTLMVSYAGIGEEDVLELMWMSDEELQSFLGSL